MSLATPAPRLRYLVHFCLWRNSRKLLLHVRTLHRLAARTAHMRRQRTQGHSHKHLHTHKFIQTHPTTYQSNPLLTHHNIYDRTPKEPSATGGKTRRKWQPRAAKRAPGAPKRIKVHHNILKVLPGHHKSVTISITFFTATFCQSAYIIFTMHKRPEIKKQMRSDAKGPDVTRKVHTHTQVRT